jgi:hypothetical protein
MGDSVSYQHLSHRKSTSFPTCDAQASDDMVPWTSSNQPCTSTSDGLNPLPLPPSGAPRESRSGAPFSCPSREPGEAARGNPHRAAANRGVTPGETVPKVWLPRKRHSDSIWSKDGPTPLLRHQRRLAKLYGVPLGEAWHRGLVGPDGQSGRARGGSAQVTSTSSRASEAFLWARDQSMRRRRRPRRAGSGGSIRLSRPLTLMYVPRRRRGPAAWNSRTQQEVVKSDRPEPRLTRAVSTWFAS